MLKQLAITALVLGSSIGIISTASAQEDENRALVMAEANYLCTKTGSVRIDSGFTTEVTIDNSTNIYHGGNAKTIYVVDAPGGEGSVGADAGAGEIRTYPAATRRLSRTHPLKRLDERLALSFNDWGQALAGETTVIFTHEDGKITYRERVDFGGGAGRFINWDQYGTCKRFTSDADLPQTVAMKEGLSGEAAETFLDEWEAEIEEMVEQQRGDDHSGDAPSN